MRSIVESLPGLNIDEIFVGKVRKVLAILSKGKLTFYLNLCRNQFFRTGKLCNINMSLKFSQFSHLCRKHIKGRQKRFSTQPPLLEVHDLET